MVKNVLAFDFGASGGRAILGSFDGTSIRLQEVHRFSNDPVMVRGTMYWDALRLFHEIKQGIRLAKEYGAVESIGVDTWGVDFGLLDADGFLLENPVHYRDARTAGLLAQALEKIDKNTLYERTGRDESAQIYKEKVQASPLNDANIVLPQLPWYRKMFE